MKVRESGMPDEGYWNSFFDADCLVDILVADEVNQGDIVELGIGYGTFTIPAARKTSGIVHGIEIEADLVSLVQNKCERYGIRNVHLETRDFVLDGTGLNKEIATHVMIYNLLHIEYPVELLKEAYRILKSDGVVSIIHWRRDIFTPRGPSLDIRPGPEKCIQWGKQAGFQHTEMKDISAGAPFHYGICFHKTINQNKMEIG